jgi:hypothetical protein
VLVEIDRIYVYIFIKINDNIYICIVFLKKWAVAL